MEAKSPCRHPPAPPPSPVKPYWWDGEDDNDNDNNNNKKRGIHDDDNDEADEIPVFSRGIFVGKKSYRFFKYEIEASTVNLHIIHILIEIHIVLRVICHLSEVQSTNNLCWIRNNYNSILLNQQTQNIVFNYLYLKIIIIKIIYKIIDPDGNKKSLVIFKAFYNYFIYILAAF